MIEPFCKDANRLSQEAVLAAFGVQRLKGPGLIESNCHQCCQERTSEATAVIERNEGIGAPAS